MMNKVDKSQVIVLFVLALLLVITPFLPSSMKPSYLYFIFNILIIALGAEAGLLSAFSQSQPSEDRKQPVSATQKSVIPPEPQEKEASSITNASSVSEQNEKKPKVFEKSASEKIVVGVAKVDKVKKCSSMPSLLYIEGGEAELEVKDKELEAEEELEVEDEMGGVNGQEELFAKAEAFIGNFYKQLKMQREESWTSQRAY